MLPLSVVAVVTGDEEVEYIVIELDPDISRRMMVAGARVVVQVRTTRTRTRIRGQVTGCGFSLRFCLPLHHG